MRLLPFLVVILILCTSCNSDIFKTTQKKVFSFPSLTNVEGLAFDSASNTIITSLVADDKNNVYILGYFTGVMDGVTSQGSDAFLLKLDAAGNLVWKIHLDSSLTEILNSGLNETADSMIWSQVHRAVYFVGSTTSPLIEGNPSATKDLFAAKVSETGALTWIKHYGQDTQNSLSGFSRQSCT